MLLKEFYGLWELIRFVWQRHLINITFLASSIYKLVVRQENRYLYNVVTYFKMMGGGVRFDKMKKKLSHSKGLCSFVGTTTLTDKTLMSCFKTFQFSFYRPHKSIILYQNRSWSSQSLKQHVISSFDKLFQPFLRTCLSLVNLKKILKA